MKKNVDRKNTNRRLYLAVISAVALSCGAASAQTNVVAATNSVVPATLPAESETNSAAVLPPIVVTGTGVPRPIKDTAVLTEVLSAATIAKTASRTFSDAIEYQPGLRTDVTCENCNADQVQMFGLGQRYVAMLVDGHPLLSGVGSSYGIDQIPAALIDRVEVVEGGGSALYGPGAVAGVVNIIETDPLVTGGSAELDYSYIKGQLNGYGVPLDGNLVLNYANTNQTFGATVYGVHNYVPPCDETGDGFTEVSRRDLWTAGTRLYYKPTENTTLHLDYNFIDENRRGGSDDVNVPPDQSVLTEWIHSFDNNASLTLDQTISPVLDFSSSLTFSRTTWDYYRGGIAAYGSPDPTSPYYSPDAVPDLGYGTFADNLWFFNTAVNIRPADGHIITIGVDYRNEHINQVQNVQVGTSSTVEPEPFDYFYENFGIFAQHDWTLSPQWNIVYGLRLDKHNLVDEVIPSPRLAVKYSPTENFRLRGAVSTGFTAPELDNEDFDGPVDGNQVVRIYDAPNLKPERSLNLSLAPEWEVNSHVRLDGNLFYTMLSDTFNEVENDAESTPNIEVINKVNAGRSDIYGVELNLGLDFYPVKIDIGYVEQRARYENPQVVIGSDPDPNSTDNEIFSSNLPRVPQRYGVVKVDYEAPWNMDLFVAGKLTGPMEVPHVVSDETTGDQIDNVLKTTPYFFDMDIGLSKSWQLSYNTLLTFSMGVKNVLNSYQSDFDRGAYRDSNYIYGPRIPRNFYVGLKYEF